MSYRKGDVVLVPWVFYVDGVPNHKPRPAVIYDVFWDQQYAAIQVTHTNRSDKLPGLWITMDSKAGKKMGLKTDSFVSVANMKIVRLADIIMFIGRCPYMDDIQDIIDREDIVPPEPEL